MLIDKVQACSSLTQPVNFNNNSEINFCAGNLCCTTSTKGPHPTCHDNKVSINKNIARNLKLPAGSYLGYYSSPRSIYLGPVVGVLTTAIKRGQKPPTGKVGRLFKEMVIFGRKNGVFIYLFGTQTDVSHGQIRGFTLDKEGNWYSGVFPQPDIVYNRIRFRKIEAKPGVQKLLNDLHNRQQVFVFNSRFLDKWEVYQALRKHHHIKTLLPETMPYSLSSMQAGLQVYPEMFLKPKHGSIGKGIIKIARTKQNDFRFCAAGKNEPRWRKEKSIIDLDRSLRRAGVQEEYYLLQRGVELSTFKGRVFDLRTQVQKNGRGLWVKTGIAVRLAGKNRFITHIPNGGKAMDYEEIINRVFLTEETKQNLKSQLDLIFELVPGLLEEELGLNLGILSMDIGIDSGGQVWLLEVNSKPSSFDEKHIRKQHLQLLTDYFVFAARQAREQNSQGMGG